MISDPKVSPREGLNANRLHQDLVVRYSREALDFLRRECEDGEWGFVSGIDPALAVLSGKS